MGRLTENYNILKIFLESNNIDFKYFLNLVSQNKLIYFISQDYFNFVTSCLNNSFVWKNSKEGIEFWNKIYLKWVENHTLYYEQSLR